MLFKIGFILDRDPPVRGEGDGQADALTGQESSSAQDAGPEPESDS